MVMPKAEAVQVIYGTSFTSKEGKLQVKIFAFEYLL
jgi:hypothetical protein